MQRINIDIEPMLDNNLILLTQILWSFCIASKDLPGDKAYFYWRYREGIGVLARDHCMT